jgi:undecaprenyl-diphosphatase
VRRWAEEVLESPWVAAGGLLITGALLVLSYRFGRGAKRFTDLTWREALVIGCFQAFALLPGVSRSGSTIVGGILCGLSPAEAAVFAFLLAVPVMLGAGCLEALELASHANTSLHLPQLLLGVAIAGIVGWLAIAWLMRWVRTGRLLLFAYWVFAVGGGTFLWLLLEAGTVGGL